MELSPPLQTFIAYEVAYYSDRDVIRWAEKFVPNSEYFSNESALTEILYLNTKLPREVEKAGDRLRTFVTNMWPEFDLCGEKAQGYAKTYFKRRLEEYAQERCRPYDVCKMIEPIEQLFDFPSWLGDMYNACDWIEPNDKPMDCRHLLTTVMETLNAL